MENKNKKIVEKEKNADNLKYKKLNNFWKLRRGSNYNAFHRKNLGSIPSKFDNFIFKLPDESKANLTSTLQPSMFQDENLCFRRDIFKHDHKSWNNFGSGNSIELKGNSLKFSVNNTIKNIKKNKSEYDLTNLESFKTLYSNTNNSTAQSAINSNIKDKDKEKEKGKENKMNKDDEENKDKSNDYKKISTKLYIPKNKSKSLSNKFNREDRYDNVYYKKVLLDKYYPGPGDYEIDEFNINNQKNPLRYNSLFKCKSSFPLIELKNTMYNIGPGSYNSFIKKKVQGGTFSKLLKSNNLNNLFSYNKDEYSNIGPGWLDLPGGINVHEKNKMSHFFLLSPDKEVKLEKKYGIERNEMIKMNKDTNKFGEFNVIPRWSNKEKTKDFNNDWINKNLQKKIIEEKMKGNIVDFDENTNVEETDDKIKQDVFYWAKMVNDELKIGKEMAMKKKGVYTFSKIPKLIEEKNHVPGPAFYPPDKILKGIKLKKEFNCNLDMNWI